MAKFNSADLRKKYDWTTSKGTAEVVQGFPANVVFNSNQGHEVLHFINRYMEDIGWFTKISFNNIEVLIRDWLPLGKHNHKEVKEWLDANLRLRNQKQ